MSESYRRREGVKETPVDADLFLVLPANGEIFHLNPLGAALWRLLAEPTSETEAGDMLALAFPDMPADALAADVRGFLAALRAQNLLEPA